MITTAISLGPVQAVVADARVRGSAARPGTMQPASLSRLSGRIPIDAGTVGVIETLVLTGGQ